MNQTYDGLGFVGQMGYETSILHCRAVVLKVIFIFIIVINIIIIIIIIIIITMK